MEEFKNKQENEPKTPQSEKKETIYDKEGPFTSVDLKFIKKNKKYINEKIEEYAGKYLSMIRPNNDKKVTIDPQAKDQIMYIFYRLLEIVSKMEGTVPDHPSEIARWIEKSLDTSTSNYKIYMFLIGATKDFKYNLMCSETEDKMLTIVSELIEDENMQQHAVELFLLFIKRFSDRLSNNNWKLTKKTDSIRVNSILRNMNNNNINPDIFDEIFEFTNYCKSQNSK